MTEDQLVRGCVLKNEAAQKAVFDLYAGKMLGVCMRYARNNADAEDMLQDAFIKVFDKIKQFKGEGSFEGWIRKIVVNTALKKYTLIRYDKEIIGHEGVDTEQFFQQSKELMHICLKKNCFNSSITFRTVTDLFSTCMSLKVIVMMKLPLCWAFNQEPAEVNWRKQE